MRLFHRRKTGECGKVKAEFLEAGADHVILNMEDLLKMI